MQHGSARRKVALSIGIPVLAAKVWKPQAMLRVLGGGGIDTVDLLAHQHSHGTASEGVCEIEHS